MNVVPLWTQGEVKCNEQQEDFESIWKDLMGFQKKWGVGSLECFQKFLESEKEYEEKFKVWKQLPPLCQATREMEKPDTSGTRRA